MMLKRRVKELWEHMEAGLKKRQELLRRTGRGEYHRYVEAIREIWAESTTLLDPAHLCLCKIRGLFALLADFVPRDDEMPVSYFEALEKKAGKDKRLTGYMRKHTELYSRETCTVCQA